MISPAFSVTQVSESDALSSSYLHSIFHVGFESRSTYQLKSRLPHSMRYHAFGFHRETPEQKRNTTIAKKYCDVQIVDDTQYSRAVIDSLSITGKTATLYYDYSSCNRIRLASFFLYLKRLYNTGIDLNVCFAYSFAKYTAPPKAPTPIMSFGPVLATYDCPMKPGAQKLLVLGIGYEQEKAIGILEHLEPSACYVFKPVGGVGGFDTSVSKSNTLLLDLFSRNGNSENLISYPVGEFNVLFSRMFSLIESSSIEDNVYIVPMGPKPFTLSSFLAEMLSSGGVSIWRASSENSEPVVNREANGNVMYVRFKLVHRTEPSR